MFRFVREKFEIDFKQNKKRNKISKNKVIHFVRNNIRHLKSYLLFVVTRFLINYKPTRKKRRIFSSLKDTDFERMVDDINPNETALLIPRTGVPSGPRDHRLPYQKRLAVYLILATTTLESIAFYSLTVNLFIILRNETSFNWDTAHTISLSFIFSGKTNFLEQ